MVDNVKGNGNGTNGAPLSFSIEQALQSAQAGCLAWSELGFDFVMLATTARIGAWYQASITDGGQRQKELDAVDAAIRKMLEVKKEPSTVSRVLGTIQRLSPFLLGKSGIDSKAVMIIRNALPVVENGTEKRNAAQSAAGELGAMVKNMWKISNYHELEGKTRKKQSKPKGESDPIVRPSTASPQAIAANFEKTPENVVSIGPKVLASGYAKAHGDLRAWLKETDANLIRSLADAILAAEWANGVLASWQEKANKPAATETETETETAAGTIAA